MRVKVLTKKGHNIVDLNRRKAIKLKCLDCSGFYYKEVATCSFIDCELYRFRSGKGDQNAKMRNVAIRGYCLWCMAGQYSEVSKCPSKDCSLYPFRKSRIDRSVEIKSLMKKANIECVFCDENN